MFYITYLLEFGKYNTVPHTWINDADIVLEKFTESDGVNSTQIHLCFWSNSPDAKKSENGNDIPNAEFVPNFFAAFSNDFPCENEEGTFYCQIVAFRGEQFIPAGNSFSFN